MTQLLLKGHTNSYKVSSSSCAIPYGPSIRTCLRRPFLRNLPCSLNPRFKECLLNGTKRTLRVWWWVEECKMLSSGTTSTHRKCGCLHKTCSSTKSNVQLGRKGPSEPHSLAGALAQLLLDKRRGTVLRRCWLFTHILEDGIITNWHMELIK